MIVRDILGPLLSGPAIRSQSQPLLLSQCAVHLRCSCGIESEQKGCAELIS